MLGQHVNLLPANVHREQLKRKDFLQIQRVQVTYGNAILDALTLNSLTNGMQAPFLLVPEATG
jgi:hypothetical protein